MNKIMIKPNNCFRTVVIFLAIFFAHSFIVAQDSWHIVRKPVKSVEASLTYSIHAPNITANEWIAFAAHPIELPNQEYVSASIGKWGSLVIEDSILRRPVLFARVPVDFENTASPNSVEFKVVYRATLFSRQLMRGPADATPDKLNDLEKAAYVRTSPTCDFDDRTFRSWLSKKRLLKKKSESVIAFAKRAAAVLRNELDYRLSEESDWKASRVCKDNSSTCGGISNCYVAILRANGIPARNLSGRLTKSASGRSGSCHNRAEFFSENVGWIPVDISSTVSFKDSPLENHFGIDRGDMIYFHVDTDLVFDTKNIAGVRTVPFAQWIHYWVDGTGSWKNHETHVEWDVKEVPLISSPN